MVKLKLESVKQKTSDVRTFTFSSSEKLSWQAGQFLHYTLNHPNPDDRGVERWFTIASPPFSGKVQITTRILADKASSFKRALSNLKPGDEIDADSPEGDFVIDDIKAEYILIAGGIGITPFHSILLQMNHESIDLHAHLLYANRDENYVFKDEFGEIEPNMPNLKISNVIDPNKIEEANINAARSIYKNPFYYISGPEPMVEFYKELLIRMGIAEDQILGDYFPGYEWKH